MLTFLRGAVVCFTAFKCSAQAEERPVPEVLRAFAMEWLKDAVIHPSVGLSFFQRNAF